MSQRVSAARVAAAIDALTSSTTLGGLAQALCERAAEVTNIDEAVLVERSGGVDRQICRHPTNQSASPMSTGVTTSAEALLSSRQLTDLVTTVEISTTGPDVRLLIPGSLDPEQHDVVLLLADVASIVIDRLRAETDLAGQSARMQSLTDRMHALQQTLSGPLESSPDSNTSGFALAAGLLTDRERDILETLLSGASNAEIAVEYTLSIETVKTHVKHILRKMGASNRAELIARSG
ncbi:regulatory LuxR family protein [Williamsia limnetica]|uniref:Regulatory LuxR family protein n=1 Tax=Williamsia limnetica TaxID=882452 RepID=A0A318RGY1_WILLI|nr:LuxR family transcriptional regulator [Williamsia limnetica]PYE12332.1 regulatory LuxR family protein [Williamsia limnetica]